MAALYEGDWLAGFLATPVNRWWTTTFLTADQTRTRDYPLCGMKYYTEQLTLNVKHPQALVECYASAYPFAVQRGMWDVAYCGALVCRGANYASIYESHPGGDPDSLRSFVQHMYPGTDVISYAWNSINTSGITDVLDPLDVFTAQFLGTAITDSITQFVLVTEALQPEFNIVIGDANFNFDNTILHYTKIGKMNPEKAKYLYSDNSKKVIIVDDEKKVVEKVKVKSKTMNPIFTDWLGTELTGVSNSMPFSPNMVGDDLTKVLSMTLVNQTIYQGIFNESISLPMDGYCVNDPVELDIMTGAAFAHHYAGSGDEANNTNDAKVNQAKGGGFFGTIAQTTADIFQKMGI